MNKKFLFAVLISVISTFSVFGQIQMGTKANPYNVNLIKNGGAEAGSSAPWTNGNELKIFRYDGGWGDAWQVMPPDRADNYFYASLSKDAPDIAFSQTIDVSKIATTIDTGKVGYDFGGWFGVRGDSAGRLKVVFLSDKESTRPSRNADATEEITAANRPNDTTMVEKKRSGQIPAGTRIIKITLEFSLFHNRTTNEGDTAIADSLSFILRSEKQ